MPSLLSANTAGMTMRHCSARGPAPFYSVAVAPPHRRLADKRNAPRVISHRGPLVPKAVPRGGGSGPTYTSAEDAILQEVGYDDFTSALSPLDKSALRALNEQDLQQVAETVQALLQQAPAHGVPEDLMRQALAARPGVLMKLGPEAVFLRLEQVAKLLGKPKDFVLCMHMAWGRTLQQDPAALAYKWDVLQEGAEYDAGWGDELARASATSLERWLLLGLPTLLRVRFIVQNELDVPATLQRLSRITEADWDDQFPEYLDWLSQQDLSSVPFAKTSTSARRLRKTRRSQEGR